MSSEIKVKEFLNSCMEVLNQHDLGLADDDNLGRAILQSSLDRIDPRDLGPPGGYTKERLGRVDETRGLKVLEQRKLELSKGKKRGLAKIRTSDAPEIHNLFNRIHGGHPSGLEGKEKLVSPDLVMKLHIYRSSKVYYCPASQSIEFEVLGQTTLTSLRDMLSCPMDLLRVTNKSDERLLARDVYRSAFFFIGGTFYNDMRHRSCIDLSEPIREWALDRSDYVGPFQTKRMEDCRFIDLTLGLGKQYLYVHQGNCEHILQFTDLRVITDRDCQYPCEYPMKLTYLKDRKPRCLACRKMRAEWIVRNHDLSPEDPSHYCNPCLNMFLYKNGKLLDPRVRIALYPGE